MKLSQNLRTTLIIIFLMIILAPAVITTFYTVQMSNETLEKLAITTQFGYARTLTHNIESFLATVKGDILFLSQSAPLKAYLASRTETEEEIERKRQILEEEFLAFSRSRGIYYQIRYLNETGKEVVRVDSDGTVSKSIERNNLQDKSKRYYFKETMVLSGQEIFVSPLDLNRERGQIEAPYKPVIRYAINVYYDNTQPAGIVILNVDANQFLKPLEGVRLVNQEGYFASHPEPTQCWGGSNDLNTGYQLSDEYPKLAEKILGQTGVHETNTVILSHQKVKIPSSPHQWTLILQANKDEIANNTTDFYVILTAIFINIGLIGLLWVIAATKTDD